MVSAATELTAVASLRKVPDFNQTWSWTDIRKKSPNIKFHCNPSLGSRGTKKRVCVCVCARAHVVSVVVARH